MTLAVKICGLKDQAAVAAAVRGGADFVGFVFFPPSPRFVPPETAGALGAAVPKSVLKVGLVVDADDGMLEKIVATAKPDMLQLHGKESPARAAQIRARSGLPVMKALSVARAADLDAARDFEDSVDRFLFDAVPPKGATRPGGNAEPFDWALLAGRSFAKPWLLAGGLTAGNLADAVRRSAARGVDVSSGVESAPGAKDPEKILEFLRVAKSL
ncbi:MAG: phosphoribosylanthranilate isomerase [Alphaproteobacteria bacterium]|nr:phosphoribosylanthranilate isomerase [Alphaproteobacteria bacterium]